MSSLKSYSEARKELERIASKRKHFFSNSKILKDELDIMASAPSSSPSTPGMSGLASRAADRLFSSPTSRSGSPLRSSHRDWSAERSAAARSLKSSPPSSMRIMAATHPFSSSSSSSGLDGLGYSDRAYGIGSGSSLEPSGSFLPGPASSVIAAFRQLQTKARQIEQERSDAIRERDDLRRQLDGNMRTQSFWRTQSDLQANDSFQTMRAATEQILQTKRDLEPQIMSASDVNLSLQRSNASDRALLVTIENEVAAIKTSIHVAQTQNRSSEHEVMAMRGRCERVADTVEASPDARLKQVSITFWLPAFGTLPYSLCISVCSITMSFAF